MKSILGTIILMMSFSSFAQVCGFKEILFLKSKNNSYKIAQVSSSELFDLETGEVIYGNNREVQRCVEYGDNSGIFGRWEEVRFCYNVVSRNNSIEWNLDNSQQGYFTTLGAAKFPNDMFTSGDSESTPAAYFSVGKKYYVGLVLSNCY